MTNPWTKKNRFLSMFLSSANAATGKARGLWMQQARRNQTAAVKQAARSWAELWTPVSESKRKRTKMIMRPSALTGPVPANPFGGFVVQT
jgi:hypothetical protein